MFESPMIVSVKIELFEGRPMFDISNQDGAREADDFRIVIVGTGFSGIAMGVMLNKAGIDSFTILEKEEYPAAVSA